MMTHKKVSEIVKHWGLEKELVSDIFYEGNGERCENAFFIGDDFVLKFTSDFDEMQNHISLAKSLENDWFVDSSASKNKFRGRVCI